MDNRPIGIFDSGVGGLSVVKALKEHLPRESFIYFADLVHMPYGPRSRNNIIDLATQICTFLSSREVKAILLACGTATANALPILRERFRLPVYGVIEDGVKAAIEASENGHIGIIATEAAVRTGEFRRRLEANWDGNSRGDGFLKVEQQACPDFVLLAEQGKFETAETYAAAAKYLENLKKSGIDTLVLGCTHYPLLKRCISETVGGNVRLINPSEELVKQLKAEWSEKGMLADGSGQRSERYFATADLPGFARSYRTIMGTECPDLKQALPLKIVSGTEDNVHSVFGVLAYSPEAGRARIAFDWKIDMADRTEPVRESIDIFFDGVGRPSRLKRVSSDAKMDFVPERETDGSLFAGGCRMELKLLAEKLEVEVNPLRVRLSYRVDRGSERYLFEISEE